MKVSIRSSSGAARVVIRLHSVRAVSLTSFMQIFTAQDYLNTDTNEAPVAGDDEGHENQTLTIDAEDILAPDALPIGNIGR